MEGNITHQSISQNGIKLALSLAFGGMGIAFAFKTNTGLESLSVLVIGLSILFGLIVGLESEIESFEYALDRGFWLIAGIFIFTLIAFIGEESSVPLLISFALAFSGSVIISTLAVTVVRKLRRR
ncbi:hypothetical protein HTG_16655 [Natrinema mahii]|nr:hypothetical protein HTG_16655 [Natrinema mahii]